MKGTKKFNTILFVSLFFIAGAFAISCSSPIGALLIDPKAAVDPNYIRAEPKKFLYDINNWFKPADDLEVFGNFGGEEELIDINKVEIKIIKNPGMIGEQEEVPVPNQEGLFLLEFEGIKKVVVKYGVYDTSYNIQVGAPGTGSNNGWDNEGGAGIVINWN